MWLRCFQFFILTCLLTFASAEDTYIVSNITFPKYFKFGTASAAYQVEGGWADDGKGANIWDEFTHNHPNRIVDRSNGDVAADTYNKYKEDIALMKDMGVSTYRFSIAWSRVLPTGYSDKINEVGLQYYRDLIAELKANDIEPLVTMYHWDLPQKLQEDFGGFLSEKIIELFVEYARILFREFGDDVKWWATFNEPKQVCESGYGVGGLAPNIISPGVGDYICAHNLLRAHAKAYRMYDAEFRKSQQGKISMVIDSNWFEPASDSKEDREAAEQVLLFTYGWFGHPIFKGDYPQVMKDRIKMRSLAEGYDKSRLPEFTEEQKIEINNTADYLCVNIYTSSLAQHIEDPEIGNSSRTSDIGVKAYQPSTWEGTVTRWFKVVPWGARKLLKWLSDTYDNPEIVVTENGYHDNGTVIDDLETRGRYHKLYLSNIQDAIYLDNVNVTGYTAWSLIDDFEWQYGYTIKLGFYHIDFNDPERPRTPKASSAYYKHICHTYCLLETCIE